MVEKRGPGRPRIAKEDTTPKIDTAIRVDGMTPQQTPKSTVQVDETAPTIYRMLAESGQIDASKLDYSTFINDLIPDGIAAKYGMKLATVTELAGNGDPKLMVSGSNPSNGTGNGDGQPQNIVSMKDVENAVNSANVQRVLNAQIADLVGDPTKGGTQTAGDGIGQMVNGMMQMMMIETLTNKLGVGQSQQHQQNPEMMAIKVQLDAIEKKNEMQALIVPLQSQITSMEKIIRDLSTNEKKPDPAVENEIKALREQIVSMTKMNEFSDALKQTVEPLQKQIDELGTKRGTDRFDESLRRETEAREQTMALQSQNLEQRLANEIRNVQESIPVYQDPTEQLGKTVDLIGQVQRFTNPDASGEDRNMDLVKTGIEHLAPVFSEVAAGYRETQRNRADGRAEIPHRETPKPTYECPGCASIQELGNEAQREATCTNCGVDVVLDPYAKTVDLANPIETHDEIYIPPPNDPPATPLADAVVVNVAPDNTATIADVPNVAALDSPAPAANTGIPPLMFALD